MSFDLGVYAGRKVLVTGHTGFKGSWLSLCLDRLGAKVTGYALGPPTRPCLFELAALAGVVDDQRGDVRHLAKLSEVVWRTRPEFVFHLAAQAIVRRSYEEPKETFDVNTGGTVNLLEALRTCASVRAVVVVTSDKCYEDTEAAGPYREEDPLGGHDPYSASKAACELVCSSYCRSFFERERVGLATARSGNVVGGGDWAEDRIVPDMARAFEADRPVAVRHPSAVRPWLHVLDPLVGYLALAARLFEGAPVSGPWNFGPPAADCRPVRELVERFISAYGSGRWEDASTEQAGTPREADALVLAADKAREHLQWQPRWSFEESVRRTARWYKKRSEGVDARTLCQEDMDAYWENA